MLGSRQRPPTPGSQWRSSDLSASMGFVWPRGSQGKTINIGLTGVNGLEEAGGEHEKARGPKGLGPCVPRVKDSRG